MIPSIPLSSVEPLVSVIIPTFNTQAFICETLDSILTQTYKNLEIIVVDDGSTDQTSQVVSSYHPRVLYHYQRNSGAGPARNTGMKNSSGGFFCFIDADDLMTADRITRQMDFMIRHPHVALVFSDYQNFNEDGCLPKSHFQTCPLLWSQLEGQKELVLESPCVLLAQENFGGAGSLLMRKNVLKLEVGFEPSLRVCEDFHFYYRLARHSPVGIINEVGMLRRFHGNNTTNNRVKMISDGIRSRSLLLSDEKSPRARYYLSQYIVDCYDALARHYEEQGCYLRALQENWKILSSDFCWPRLRNVCRSVARMILMAIGVHNPEMKKC